MKNDIFNNNNYKLIKINERNISYNNYNGNNSVIIYEWFYSTDIRVDLVGLHRYLDNKLHRSKVMAWTILFFSIK